MHAADLQTSLVEIAPWETTVNALVLGPIVR